MFTIHLKTGVDKDADEIIFCERGVRVKIEFKENNKTVYFYKFLEYSEIDGITER